jgi:hypothetical protein
MFMAAEKRSNDDEVSKTGDEAPFGRDDWAGVKMWMDLRATHNYVSEHGCLKPRVASFQCNGGLKINFRRNKPKFTSRMLLELTKRSLRTSMNTCWTTRGDTASKH